MAPTVAADLPTLDFGRWVARSQLVLPVPLNAGHAARVELPWEELLEVSDDRIAVRNAREATTVAAAAAQRAARDLDPRVRELMPYAEGVLRAPDYAMYAGRTETDTGRSLLAVGFGRGAEGLVVVDQLDTVRLVRTSASELAVTVAGHLPATTAAAIRPVEVSERTLTDIHRTSGVKGMDRRTAERLTSQAVPAATADVLTRLSAYGSATGIIGAVAYGATEPRVSERDAVWVEGRPGAVLKTTLGGGRFRFESATRNSVVSALIAALEDARRADKGRR